MSEGTVAAAALDRLLRPRSIAVVGASDNPSRIGGRPIRILQNGGYAGEIYPVNPKYESVFGIDCYHDVSGLPDEVDLYIFCIPAAATVPAFEEAAAKGGKAAVVFGGGFAEVGDAGRQLQSRLRQIAEAAGIPVCGPNTLGYASFANASYATFATALESLRQPSAGSIALLSQSGGTAFNLFVEARSAGARFSHVVATGNEVNVSFADYLSYFAEDQATTAIVGYMEGLAEGASFARSLERARQLEVPVFLIKAGSTERGALAAQSHTAQISGNDAAFDATFERYGATRLTTFTDVVDVCRALALPRIEKGVAIATNSGGAAVYLSDLCERHGVPLSPLSPKTRQSLSEKLPAFAGLANPIDFTAQVLNDPQLLAQTIEVLDGDDTVETIIVFLGSMEALADSLINTVRAAKEKCVKPLVLTWMGVTSEVRVRAEAAGLVVCDDPARVLSGIGKLRRNRTGLSGPSCAAREDPDESSSAVLRHVGEHELKEKLAGYGIGVPRSVLVTSSDEAVRAGEELSYPCVAKVVRPVLAHKTNAGAIRLGIGGPAAMKEAFAALEEAVPGLETVLVEEQVVGHTEVIVGLLADETFGTRGVLGAGGVAVSSGEEVATLIPPYSPDYVLEELEALGLVAQIEEQLDAETAASWLARLLGALSSVLSDSGLAELECNPVVFSKGSLVVLDALGVARDPEQKTTSVSR